ncbi:unnamed protein product [Absidia cylindrospora]
MQVTEQRPIDENEGKLEVPAFLGLTEQQSKLLVALYNETDPNSPSKYLLHYLMLLNNWPVNMKNETVLEKSWHGPMPNG